jgi:class 3 adenylate cyclase
MAFKFGERSEAAVIFADMQDFTKFSETMDPEELDKHMTSVFEAFTQIIQGYGGQVEKYIGDALVAVFGVSEKHGDDSQRAVLASLDFIQLGLRPTFRIGIHSGLLTSGQRGEYSVVTGHPLAVASRIQSEAAPNSILISDAVKRQLNGDFLISDFGSLQVKGISEPVRVSMVQGKNELKAKKQPFVGRDREIQSMLSWYLTSDRTACAYLWGESGIGKSRLLEQFYLEVQKFPRFNSAVMRLNIRSYGRTGESGLAEALKVYFSISGNEQRDTLAKNLSSRVPESILQELTDYLLCGSCNLELTDMLSSLFLHLLSESGVYAPLLILDNASRLRKDERDAFRILMEKAKRKPFVLLSDKIIDRELVSVFSIEHELELAGLNTLECRELIVQIDPTASAELIDNVIEKTDGNPLFIMEMMRYLQDNPESKSLPVSIQNIIMASIEKFSPRTRESLKRLSVFQIPFTIEMAEPLLEDLSAKLDEDADELIEHHILIQDNGFFRFRYETIREVIYNSILNHNKRLLHELVIQKLSDEIQGCERIYHMISSGKIAEAAEEIIAFKNTDPFEMRLADFCDQVLAGEIQLETELVLELFFVKYAVLHNNNKSDKLLDILKTILNFVSRVKRPELLGRVYHSLLAYNNFNHNPDIAVFYGKKALHFYEQYGKTDYIENTLHHLIQSSMMIGEYNQAWEYCRRLKGKESAPILETELFLGTEYYSKAASSINHFNGTFSSPLLKKMKFISLKAYLFSKIGDWESLLKIGRDLYLMVSNEYKYLAGLFGYAAQGAAGLGEHEEARQLIEKAQYYSKQEQEKESMSIAVALSMLGEYSAALEIANKEYIDFVSRGLLSHSAESLCLMCHNAIAMGDDQLFRYYFSELLPFLREEIVLPASVRAQIHYFLFQETGDKDSLADAGIVLHDLFERQQDNTIVEGLRRIPSLSPIILALKRNAIHPRA